MRPRWAAIAVCLAVAALHATALVRANARWRAAGALTRGIVETFADVTNAHDPGGRSAIYILNLPDNLLGAYVFRVGFYPAVELVRPDARGHIPLTVGVASHAIVSMHDPVSVTRLGPRSFAVDFGGNRIIQPQIRSLPEFRITSQTATSYHVEFTDVVADALVLYVTAGRTEFAGWIGR